MREIALTGLHESHFPLSALAAFGLLRVCGQEIEELATARLAWRRMPRWTAVLYVPDDVGVDHLLDLVVQYACTRAGAPEFAFADHVRGLGADRYREFAQQALADARTGRRTAADFAAALAAEDPADPQDVVPTAFDMTAGQQRFLRMVRELVAALGRPNQRVKTRGSPAPADEARRALHEALFGPWRYEDRLHSFGWDPATERLHALQAVSPSSEGSPPAVKAAIWLAVEALPLFPPVLTGRRVQTAGFDPNRRALAWPMWTEPVTLDTLRSLLALGFHESARAQQLARLGVAAVFRAQRYQPRPDRYGMLRPPVLVAEYAARQEWVV